MEWSLIIKKIKDLKENPKNPRRLSKEDAKQLETSISKFGTCEPIVVNLDDTIIGGHQRVRIMKKLGYKEVEAYVPKKQLTEQESDELNIRLNKNTGEFDYDILANNWDIEDLLNWGFSHEELQIEEVESENIDGEKEKKSTIFITFQNVEHLQDAENKISEIVDRYSGAVYKIKL